ncbi:MAG: LysR family transcriptional regulator [Clostridiales bacterium]|nr:LysR family transcriptional regulator [Clostridiales bacterium]
MDIDLLKEFVVVADHLNFSKASKKLYIAQPVLSRHIADLEAQLGIQLFIRSKHSVQLTYMGELMLTEAKEIIERYEQAIYKIRQTAAGTIGTLSIGFLEGAVRNFLASLIMRYSSSYPKTDLHLVSMDLGDLTRSLKKGDIDIGFTLALDLGNSEELNIKTLYSDFYSLVVPKNHPLASRDSVEITDLKNEQFIMPSPEYFPNAMDQLVKFCNAKGFHPKIVKQTPRIDTVLLMVEIGMGVSIMPRHDVVYANSNIRFIDVMGSDVTVDVVVAWRKNNTNPLITPFLEELGLLM